MRLLTVVLTCLGLIYLPFTCQAECTPSGILTLALLNNKFPVKTAAEILQASDCPAFGFLHKSFGSKYGHVTQLLDLIGKPTTVVVYADCGPCRAPRRPEGLFPLIAPRLHISPLNGAIERQKRDVIRAFRREYQTIKAYLPARPGVSYVFEVGLEDSYTKKAYLVLDSLARQVFKDRADIRFARNPATLGDYHRGAREVHTYDSSAISQLREGDIVTGDGENLCFPGERCNGSNTAQVAQWLSAAERRGVIALLYRPELQGLSIGSGNTKSFTSPSRRNYTISERVSRYLRDLLTGE